MLQLSGTIPREIGNVESLRQFKTENNQVTGTIPEELGTLTRMNWLRFSDNKMKGTIPKSLKNTATNLTQVPWEVIGWNIEVQRFVDIFPPVP